MKFGEYKLFAPFKVEYNGTTIDTLTKTSHPSIRNNKQSCIIRQPNEQTIPRIHIYSYVMHDLNKLSIISNIQNTHYESTKHEMSD